MRSKPDSNANSDGYADANTNIYSASYGDSYPNRTSNCDAYAYSNAHPHNGTFSDTNSHTVSTWMRSKPDANADCDPNSNAAALLAYADSDRCSNSHSNANTQGSITEQKGGTGSTNWPRGSQPSFSMDLIDNGTAGIFELFSIHLSNGYSAGGILTSGDIQIH
jgi:hypothetical protein